MQMPLINKNITYEYDDGGHSPNVRPLATPLVLTVSCKKYKTVRLTNSNDVPMWRAQTMRTHWALRSEYRSLRGVNFCVLSAFHVLSSESDNIHQLMHTSDWMAHASDS